MVVKFFVGSVFNEIVKIAREFFKEVKIYKPDSKVYDLPIKKYKIEKNEVAFLSANTWDVSGAGNFGFNSIWVNRNKNIFDKLDYIPHNEINNLNELLELMKKNEQTY